MVTVRKVPDEVHRALVARAERNGHSMEAEVRLILESAVRGSNRLNLAEVLGEIGREVMLTDQEIEVFEQMRDSSPARVMDLS